MAVVVQEMVDADSAGVLFSRDPVTGNPSQIVITANYGLGEVIKRSFFLKRPQNLTVHTIFNIHTTSLLSISSKNNAI